MKTLRKDLQNFFSHFADQLVNHPLPTKSLKPRIYVSG